MPVKPDRLMRVIARFTERDKVFAAGTMTMARYCLMDALGCALQAFESADCVQHIGPIIAGTVVPHGARVPGTTLQLDPVKATFDISILIRWFDFNAVWYTGGSPADTLGTVLAVSDYVSRRRAARGGQPLLMRTVLADLIKAYEIHGMLSSANKIDSPEIGLDSTLIVKIAAAAVATRILGGNEQEIVNALSNAFVDQQPLNLYRVWPHTGPRKSWAAGDAASRAVQFALFSVAGEMGYASALSDANWGFERTFFKGRPFGITEPLADQVVTRVQFKLAFPTQRHCQSAAECAVVLHPLVVHRLSEVERVVIDTHGLALRTVNVTGLLANFAARDHCLQYIVAVALIHGAITTDSYSDAFAADPRIDSLRARIIVTENPGFTRGHHSAVTRSNANAIQVYFKDGTSTRKVTIEYPIGDSHWRERDLPLLEAKFKANIARRFPARRQREIWSLLSSQKRLEATPVHAFMDMFAL